ncbi:hypothetical protein HY637_06160 [Candidatus Woesearchaeota archaeon]|nr:hypothetical protein [Candidatus Woesearchaeota archaeon]
MQQPRQIQEFVSKIIEIKNETPTVKSFKVELPENADIKFFPGQFFMVSFVNDPEIKTARAYSIASSPLENGYLEIALNKIAAFTAKMFQLKEGDFLKLKGPYGKFYFSDEIKNNLVLIAGGTGITPLMSILRYCAGKGLSNKIQLFYSVKVPEEIIFHNEIKKAKEKNPNFEYFITITRAEEHHEWKGKRGRIDLELLKGQIEKPEEKLYFLCGSKEFVDNVISMLQNLGVKREQVKTDVWG